MSGDKEDEEEDFKEAKHLPEVEDILCRRTNARKKTNMIIHTREMIGTFTQMADKVATRMRAIRKMKRGSSEELTLSVGEGHRAFECKQGNSNRRT